VSRSSDLAEQLGCEVFEDLPNIRVDEYKETTVEGVWAVGDLVPGTQLVITSAADGAIAAVAVNKTLMPPGQKV
jgi:thioredoxin reductase (NADPH)